MIFITVITTVYCMLMFMMGCAGGSAKSHVITMMQKDGWKDYTEEQLSKDVKTLQWFFTGAYAVLTAIALLF